MGNSKNRKIIGSCANRNKFLFLFFLVLLAGCRKDPESAKLTGRWEVVSKEILYWEWSYEYVIGTYVCVDEEQISIPQGDEYFEFYLDGTWQCFQLIDGLYVSVKSGNWNEVEQTVDGYQVKKITSHNLILVRTYNQTGESYQEMFIHCQR